MTMYRATGNATSFGKICVIGYYKPALGEQARQYIAAPRFSQSQVQVNPQRHAN